jgi:hypothetical protein
MTGNCALHAAAEAGNEAAVRALLRVLGPEEVNQRNLQLSEYSQGGPCPSIHFAPLILLPPRFSCPVNSLAPFIRLAPLDSFCPVDQLSPPDCTRTVTPSPPRPPSQTPRPPPPPCRPTPTLSPPQGSWSSGAQDIAPWDKTPLALAVDAGDEGLAELLLEAGGPALGLVGLVLGGRSAPPPSDKPRPRAREAADSNSRRRAARAPRKLAPARRRPQYSGL